VTSISSSCDTQVISPVTSPFLARNVAAHIARWGIDLPCVATGRAVVTTVPRPPGSIADPSTAWPPDATLSARVQATGGALVKVHSDRDPMTETSRWLEDALPQFATAQSIAMVGAGLGYAIDWLERMTTASMLVLEPEPDLLPWLLARRDWTPLIDAGRLLLLPGPDYVAAPQAWGIFARTHRSTPSTIVHPVIARARPSAAAAAGAAIATALHGAQANALARRRFEAPYLLNTLANVGTHMTAPGIASLAGVARGRSVVIAGAGPSLNANIEQLRPHRGDVVLVAADTALPPLVQADLPPDFVVAVDPGALNARHLTETPVPPHAVLVAECSVAPAALEPFGSRVVFFRVADHAPWRWLTRAGIDPGMLRAWGSVITSAFDLALHMEGETVILIGTDLAYTGGQPYCRGTRYEDDWTAAAATLGQAVEDVWANSLEARSAVARDITGAHVRTAPHLVAYRDWLVRASVDASAAPRSMPRRIVNATGAGILHGGAIELASLADTLLPTPRYVPPFVPPTPRPARVDAHPTDRADAHLLRVLMQTDRSSTPLPVAPGRRTPYMARPRNARARDTRQLRLSHGTDTARWEDADNLDVAWERRAAAAATLVPNGARVLDLGAGREALARHIPPDASYVPADVVRRSDRTVVVDVNAGEFPSGTFDVVATLGLLEYVHDLRALLTRVADASSTLVASYCVVTGGTRDPRLQRGWMNDLVLADLLDLFVETGWHVAWAERLDQLDDFDQWLFACRRASTR
jgi:hypothetical protein